MKNDQQADELTGDDEDEDPPDAPGSSSSDLPRHRVPSTKEGKPTKKAQKNFTDPDSCLMKRDGAYLQAYNGQAAVDEEHQIIVSWRSHQPTT